MLRRVKIENIIQPANSGKLKTEQSSKMEAVRDV
jgi:hypothetical protein